MKLKKFASVAMAGVMAVSVLAGCGADNGANSGNTNTDPTTSASIVDAVNNGQAATNAVKVTFTDDSSLDAALKKAVEKYGALADDTNILPAITNMTGLEAVTPHRNWAGNLITTDQMANDQNISGNLLTKNVMYSRDYTPATGSIAPNYGSEDGATYTVYGVIKYTGCATEEAAMNTLAAKVDALVAQLSDTSDDANGDGKVDVASGKKYYDYSYDGNVSMVSVAQPNGTSVYFAVLVLNQHVAEKTL